MRKDRSTIEEKERVLAWSCLAHKIGHCIEVDVEHLCADSRLHSQHVHNYHTLFEMVLERNGLGCIDCLHSKQLRHSSEQRLQLNVVLLLLLLLQP